MKCVSVVGIGPGNELYLSIAAKETLEDSDLIVGYKKYVELVEEYLPEKEYLYTGMTKEVDEESDLIVGYKKYVELVEEYLPEKEYLYTGMTKEVDRCKMALEKAAEGNAVSVVCSGDAGVYGMAGLVYELSVDYPDVEIDIVPGISAVLSGSAVLGAPIGHDFAVISLSDLLTVYQIY